MDISSQGLFHLKVCVWGGGGGKREISKGGGGGVEFLKIFNICVLLQ